VHPGLEGVVKGILEALVSLRAVMPTACNVSVGRGGCVSLQAYDDAGVDALATVLGFEVRRVVYDREGVWWFAADGRVGDVIVGVFGPHHPIVGLDESASATAVARADAAIAEVLS
jgi:hypothetical protein